MHFNAGYLDEARLAGAAVRRGLRRLRGDRDAVGLVRRTRADARPGARRRRPRRRRAGRASSRSSSSSGAAARHRLVAIAGSLAYHPTCHSLRLLRLGDRPVSLLRAVPGVELVELPDAEECCGFGGTFAVKNADVSTAMLDAKLDSVDRERRRRGVRVRRVVPAAHRRRAAPPRLARAAGPSRRGAGLVTQAERAARPSRSRRRRREALAERPDAGERPPRDDHDPRQAGAGGRRRCRTGRSCATPARRSRTTRCSRSSELLLELEASVTSRGGVVHWARDAAEANAIVDGDRPGGRRGRGREGEVAHDRRDRAQRGARRRRGSTRSRPTWPS